MTEAPDAHVAPGFPVVGVVGGGQLARMMHRPAIALGVGLRVLATSIEESAAQKQARVDSGADGTLTVAAAAPGSAEPASFAAAISRPALRRPSMKCSTYSGVHHFASSARAVAAKSGRSLSSS